MKILHISTRLILGGSQENTVLSCEGQARRGHEVHLAFGPIYGPEGSLLDRVRDFHTGGRGITTHVVPHLVREIGPMADSRAYQELLRLIRELKPDVVHTHSSKAGVLGRAAAWRYGRCAVVHTVHGPPFMPIEGSSLARTKIGLANGFYTLAERFAAKRCHLIISVADAMTRQFLARGIGRSEQFITIRSGMETGPFLNPEPGQTRDEIRRSLGIAPEDFVIGTVARLAQHKGHDDLLDALAGDLTARPALKLLWVGDGWWRERLLGRVRELGLADRVITTGLVAPERIPGLIRAMDILAHPSFREGLPRTVPQALLCGVCPVVYDCDGAGEVCRDMRTGRLVPVGDRGRLREAILWLIDHLAERATMARRGQSECAEAFGAEKMIDQLDRAYVRAIELGIQHSPRSH